jgi:hypothetical protein
MELTEEHIARVMEPYKKDSLILGDGDRFLRIMLLLGVKPEHLNPKR